jgi:hypothetical protein
MAYKVVMVGKDGTVVEEVVDTGTTGEAEGTTYYEVDCSGCRS